MRTCISIILCLVVTFFTAQSALEYDPSNYEYNLNVLLDTGGVPGQYTLSYVTPEGSALAEWRGGPNHYKVKVGLNGWLLLRATAPLTDTFPSPSGHDFPPPSGTYPHRHGALVGEYVLTLSTLQPCDEPNIPKPTNSPDGGPGEWSWSAGFCDWIWFSAWNNPDNPPDYPGGAGQGIWIFDTSGETGVWTWTGEDYPDWWAWSEAWPWSGGPENWPDQENPPAIEDGQPVIGESPTPEDDIQSFQQELLTGVTRVHDRIKTEAETTRTTINNLLKDVPAAPALGPNIADAPDITNLNEFDVGAIGYLLGIDNTSPEGYIADVIENWDGLLAGFFVAPAIAENDTISLNFSELNNSFPTAWVGTFTWPLVVRDVREWLDFMVSMMFFYAIVRVTYGLFGGSVNNP